MPPHRLEIPTAAVSLDRTSAAPLYQQLYHALRTAIVEGRISSGTRLPSSRALAADLDISRNTVIAVYDQLSSEGYVTGVAGSGTFVAAVVPDSTMEAHAAANARSATPAAATALARFGRVAQEIHPAPAPFYTWQPFMPGVPDVSRFPTRIWRALTMHHWDRSPERLLGSHPSAGHETLRAAITGYLGATRGIDCIPDQIIIVSGTQQSVSLATRVLLEPGQRVWVENPGYGAAKLAFHAAGAKLVPVPVDGEGLRVSDGRALCEGASAAYVTPSNQFPLGVTMSAGRRFALLDWASECDAWILEDDYDSEFRYSGRPVAALQGLDRSNRVIYMGTFSKVLFPSLRLGYMIVPVDLAPTFAAAQAIDNGPVGTIEQAVLADFLLQGHFARHVRRMRKLYAERQATFLKLIHTELAGLVSASHAPAGIHLIGWLPPGVDDRSIARSAASNGVWVVPLSTLADGRLERPGLVMGYAGGDEASMRAGIARLGSAIRGVLDDGQMQVVPPNST